MNHIVIHLRIGLFLNVNKKHSKSSRGMKRKENYRIHPKPQTDCIKSFHTFVSGYFIAGKICEQFSNT